MKVLFRLMLILILSKFNLSEPEETTYIEDKIKSYIFQGYDKLTRPTFKVNIGLQLVLKQIVSLDEQNQLMTSSSNIIMFWYDRRLRWNLDNFSMPAIPVQPFQIWYPSDLFITNTADTDGFIPINSNNYMYINYDGLIGVNLGLIGNIFSKNI
jgi:hypothetical protein